MIDHVILTRFNVPTPGLEGLIRAKDGWLKDRVGLFEKYCAPSVEAQTVQSFKWLIYFDPESPQWLMDWLQQNEKHRRFHPVFRSAVSREELISDLNSLTGCQGNQLLTTNLDNDDGLAIDFVQRLQSAVQSPDRTAIYLANGIILRGDQAFYHSDRRNAFCSVRESWTDPVTAWADWHTRLDLSMAVEEIAGDPAWIQVIHARNVSNSIHGRLIDPQSVLRLFPKTLLGKASPTNTQKLLQNYVLRPLRFCKANTRNLIKSTLIAALGKRGFENAKNQKANFTNFIVPMRLSSRSQPRAGLKD